MSIMPEGGWGELTPRDNTDTQKRVPNAPVAQASYYPTTSYLRCKTCDSGTLSRKKVFRLSGPAVAIGYILLIPSVLGMMFCAIILIAINLGVVPRDSSHPYQSAFDASFRQSCAQSARRSIQEYGYYASQQLVEQYCECALTQFKVTNSMTLAAESCGERMVGGTLDAPSRDLNAFYSAPALRENLEAEGLRLLRGISSTLVVGLGVSFFVGGLLGWLLVMKKRVLQCDLCGAVVNAS